MNAKIHALCEVKECLFFDKLKQFFEHIWVISHNPLIQDWADHAVKVKKENNVSTVVESVIE
jgi:DNA repair exonuclease SbcCD ATPase subunit